LTASDEGRHATTGGGRSLVDNSVCRSVGATPATAATYNFGAVDEKTCAAFRRDAVPQSINTTQFIDAHIEPVSAAEEVYLAAENSAFKLSPIPDSFSLLASQPAFSAWQQHYFTQLPRAVAESD
jgi:hypothetical protein